MADEFNNEKWKLDMGFSDASNSQAPLDLQDRAQWEHNTRQKALSDGSNIPPGHYGGVPINMDSVSHSVGGGGGAPKWSELSGGQRRDVLIAFVIALLFFAGVWLTAGDRMQSFGDLLALAFGAVLVYGFGYLVLRALSKLLGLFRKN